MTDKLELVSDEGDNWLDAYPERHREMLMQFGVPSWMNEHADAHNRRLIAVVESGCTGEADLAAIAEQSFDEHFGRMLTDRAAKVLPAAGESSVRHVDMGATDQVSIANGIGHIMDRYRKREIAAMAGFTVDHRGAISPVIGGQTDRASLYGGLEYLRAYGIPAMLGEPQGWHNDVEITVASRGVVHTRDSRSQQAAVTRAVRTVTDRYQSGDVQFLLGVTIDENGLIEIFGGGETDGRLIETSIDVLRSFVEKLEKRYDH
jgi:hypothetical protein